jgi:hypothetical protein
LLCSADTALLRRRVGGRRNRLGGIVDHARSFPDLLSGVESECLVLQSLAWRLPPAVTGSPESEALRHMLALGFLAGRMAHRPRPRRSLDPSSFLMDRDLLFQEAASQSILRLPWFEEELFVGRNLPEISEFPKHVMRLCLEHYRAGLQGERGWFRFTSYGHAYTVESVPVRGDANEITGVLGIAVPVRPPAGRLRRRRRVGAGCRRLRGLRKALRLPSRPLRRRQRP